MPEANHTMPVDHIGDRQLTVLWNKCRQLRRDLANELERSEALRLEWVRIETRCQLLHTALDDIRSLLAAVPDRDVLDGSIRGVLAEVLG